MEKILRKVECSERLPNISGIYYASSNHEYKETFNYYIQENKWTTLGSVVVVEPEYWYEEVSVDELEDYKVAVGNLELIIEMDSLKVKERYEKAYKFAETQCCAGLVCIDLDTVNEALKIAAGLNEEEI